MKKAYVFPGQGSQKPGMGSELYQSNNQAKELFDRANEILGFQITDIMFNGSDEDLRQTKVTQPAIFLVSTVISKLMGDAFDPSMVAGHSLGEFSALVSSGALGFEDGLVLVSKRAQAMQKACEANPSTMAAILGLDDEVVEKACAEISGVVVPANYNCPGQLVISGANEAIDEACEKLTELGARRALKLSVGGAFHSPLMEPAREELEAALRETSFSRPVCPVFQNVNASPNVDPDEIRENLILQLTAPVRWTQTMQNMIGDGATEAIEVGLGNVLQGMFKKIDRAFPVSSAQVEG